MAGIFDDLISDIDPASSGAFDDLLDGVDAPAKPMQKNAAVFQQEFIRNQADNPEQYLQQVTRNRVPASAGINPAVAGIASPADRATLSKAAATIRGIPADVVQGAKAAYYSVSQKMTGAALALDDTVNARKRFDEVWQDYDLSAVSPATLAEYNRQKAEIEQQERESAVSQGILKEMHRENQQRMKQALEENQQGTEANKVFRSSIPSTIDLLIGGGLSVVATPVAGAAWMGVGTAATTYGDDVTMGIDVGKAAKNAAMQGVLETGFEYLPMKYLGKIFSGAGKFMPNMLKEMAAEQTTELLTTPSQAVSQRYFTGTTGEVGPDGKPVSGNATDYLTGTEHDSQTGRPKIVSDEIETFKQTLAQNLTMFGLSAAGRKARQVVSGRTVGEQHNWTEQQYEEFGEFTGNLAATAELKRMGLQPGKVSVPEWIAQNYPHQAAAVLDQFEQQHGFMPEIIGKREAVKAVEAYRQQQAATDQSGAVDQNQYDRQLVDEAAAFQQDSVPVQSGVENQTGERSGQGAVAPADAIHAEPVGTLAKAAAIINPYQQLANQPFASAPEQQPIADVEQTPKAGLNLNNLQAPSELEQATAWAQQQLADPALSKFERQNLESLAKSTGQIGLIRYWRSFQNRLQTPRVTPAAGGLPPSAPLVALDSAPPVVIPATAAPVVTGQQTLEPAVVDTPPVTVAGDGNQPVKPAGYRADKLRQQAADAKAAGHNVNDAGMYLDFETLPVPYTKNIKRSDALKVVQGADGQWRSGYDFARKVGDYEGGGSSPSITDEKYATREQAIQAAAEYVARRINNNGQEADALEQFNNFVKSISGDTISENIPAPTPAQATKTDGSKPVASPAPSGMDTVVNFIHIGLSKGKTGNLVYGPAEAPAHEAVAYLEERITVLEQLLDCLEA